MLNASYVIPSAVQTSCPTTSDPSLVALRERPLLWTLRAVWLTDRPLCRVLPGGTAPHRSHPTPLASRGGPVYRATAPELANGDDPEARQHVKSAQSDGQAGGEGAAGDLPTPLSAFGVAELLGREHQASDMCAQVYTLARPGQPSPCVLIELGPGSVATPASLTPFFIVHATASIQGVYSFEKRLRRE